MTNRDYYLSELADEKLARMIATEDLCDKCKMQDCNEKECIMSVVSWLNSAKLPPAPKPDSEEVSPRDMLYVNGLSYSDWKKREKAKYNKHRRSKYHRRKEDGICVTCGRVPAMPDKTKCGECAEKAREAQKRFYSTHTIVKNA